MKMSNEHNDFIKKHKRKRLYIILIQIFIMIVFLVTWEILGRKELINTFITSMPSKIINTIYELFRNGNLIHHIFVTLYETILSFFITFVISLVISILIYEKIRRI